MKYLANHSSSTVSRKSLGKQSLMLFFLLATASRAPRKADGKMKKKINRMSSAVEIPNTVRRERMDCDMQLAGSLGQKIAAKPSDADPSGQSAAFPTERRYRLRLVRVR